MKPMSLGSASFGSGTWVSCRMADLSLEPATMMGKGC